MPFLSVIIPVYNAEKYLKVCFDSIKRQSFTDYEVIIIDDGATDNSPQICDQYAKEDSKVKVFHVPNGGPSKARNTGFRKAGGNYIYCIDNDDEIEGNALFQAIADSLAARPVDVLQIGAKYLKEGESIPRKTLTFPANEKDKDFTPAAVINDLMLKGNYETSCWTKVINRQFLLDNELFFDESLRVEDLDWNMRFIPLLRTYNLLSNVDYVHIYHAGSVSAAKGKENYKNCMNQVTVVSHWVKEFQTSVMDTDLKKALLSYLFYQYCITLGRSMTLDLEFRKDVLLKLKDMKYIFQYAAGRKQKLLQYMYRIGGFRLCVLFLGFYFKKMSSGA